MAYFRKTRKPFNMDFWVEKDLRKNLASASMLLRIPSFHLEIAYPLPWILDLTTVDTINGVVCRVATLDYGGRNWTAYYNTDIAIPQGPYVFSGLPGLIVRIEDERGWYRFDLTDFTVKPKKEYFWRGRYYNSGSQKMARSEYVDRVAEERKNPSTGPISVTEADLLEMKQRFSRYHWWLLEQR
jgi:GLPGLI family protein